MAKLSWITLDPFTQESGQISHHTACNTMPVITAGGAGGAIQTGMFVDFSDQNTLAQSFATLIPQKPDMHPEYAGLMYNQFLTTCMLAMGVPKEGGGHSRRSHTRLIPDGGGLWPLPGRAGTKAVMGEPLPILTG